MSKYAGTKTEKNLMEHFQASPRHATNTPTMPVPHGRPALYKWPTFLRRLPTRRRSTQKCGSRSSTHR